MTQELKPWPLGGYAPGNHQNKCLSCGRLFEGDKRAYQCLVCAAQSANKAIHDLTRTRPSADADAAGVVETLDELRKQGGKTWLDKADFEALDAAIAALVASQPPAGEPVAYRYRFKNWEPGVYNLHHVPPFGADESIPLYAQPPAPVVTDAMVERAVGMYAKARYGGTVIWPRDFSPKEIAEGRENMRAALTAALTTKGDAE